MWASVGVVLILVVFSNADEYHRRRVKYGTQNIIGQISEDELNAQFWNDAAQTFLREKLKVATNTNQAKNVIFFLGDGMSMATIKAARVYKGQREGKTGEEDTLFFEKFPFTGLSRTYCVDAQVPDSACTATAFLCGVKGNKDTAGVTANVKLEDCQASLKEENRVSSIARWFQLAEKKTGFVTTTRVTHATPSALYAHTAHRDWESDVGAYDDTPEKPEECEDIALQLITSETGKNLNVIMGGGGRTLWPTVDGSSGRNDGRNLTEEWLNEKLENNLKAEYVSNKDQLKSIAEDTEYVMGIFASDHCPYNLEADKEVDPSLEEMTEAAIKMLSKGDKGYFLLVEGGKIDQAHHKNYAKKSLDETVEFDKAVKKAYEMTNAEDTLIVVTADHGHPFTVNGYPKRGNDILGIADVADDGKSYSTLSYANGPGYKESVDGARPDVSPDDLVDDSAQFPAMVPLENERHGGDDVAIFATGPWAHLFVGSVEQNYIAHAMAFASCVGTGNTVCMRKDAKRRARVTRLH